MCCRIPLWVVILPIIVAIYFSIPERYHYTKEIEIISESETIETYLTPFKEQIGADYQGYRNHIYRVLAFTKFFLDIVEKNTSYDQRIIEMALVYHDIGLWSDANLAYLEPSIEQAVKNLKSEVSAEEMRLIKDIIYWHHKITPFEGEDATVVNAVRKADWADASYGLVHYRIPKWFFHKVLHTVPEAGFHETLLALGPRLYGWNILKIVSEISTIFKW